MRDYLANPEENEETSLINYDSELNSENGKQEHFHKVEQSIEEQPIQIYRRRWWLLFVYCFTAILKVQMWNTWTPIADSVIIVFNWTNTGVALVPAMTNISLIIFALPTMYVIQIRGLRVGMVMAISWMLFVCITMLTALFTEQYWLIYVSSFATGFSSCVMLPAGSLFSATWFPVSQRNTATAFATMSGYLGLGAAYLSGPNLIRMQINSEDVINKNNLTQEYKLQLKAGIQNVVYYNTALVAIAFVLIVAYFPSKPPNPPSISQTKERKDFWNGAKHILQKPQFGWICFASSISLGVFVSWFALLDLNFKPLGVGQNSTGWIGFCATISAAVGSVIISGIADYFQRKLKTIAKIATGCGITMSLLMVCIYEKYIIISPNSILVALFILTSGVSVCVLGLIPVFFELSCEAAYPANEGLIGSILTLPYFLTSLGFFLLFLIPKLANNVNWMNWTLLGTNIVTMIILFLIKDHYPRLDLEKEDNEDENE